MAQKVFITRQLPESLVAPLRDLADVKMWMPEDEAVPAGVLAEEMKQADALLTMITDTVNGDMMERADRLKGIANMAVGFNNIDVKAAKEKGIIVTNTPDVLTEATADLTFALMMSAARRMTSAEYALRNEGWTSWSPFGFAGMDVHGTAIGIIGMGRIGEAVGRRAKGFGMKIMYHNRSRNSGAEADTGAVYEEMDDLLRKADHVVILAPFTEETKGMIGTREIGLMKRTATITVASRGGIVDEAALYEALRNGEIWAAGLDVYNTEPVPVRHPLLTLPNVTALPHVGSATVATRNAMARMSVQAVMNILQGREPANRVV